MVSPIVWSGFLSSLGFLPGGGGGLMFTRIDSLDICIHLQDVPPISVFGRHVDTLSHYSLFCITCTVASTQYKMIFKQRLAFALFLLLSMLFFLCIVWTFVTEQDRTTKVLFSKLQVHFKATNQELDFINNGVQSIINKISPTKRNETLPKWIERFAAPHWSEFKTWRGVFVFFVTYRYAYLKKCLESIALASKDIDKSSVCVFALDRTPKTTGQEINQTLALIRKVTFCKVVEWNVEKEAYGIKKKNFVMRLKRLWWFVLESVFKATISGKLVKVLYCEIHLMFNQLLVA